MLQELAFRSMNTQIQTLIESSDYVPELEDRIKIWFSQTEQRFSRFRNDSELSQLNQFAGERCLISEDMLQVLEQSRYYMEQTTGAFSIFVHHALQNAGYGDSFEHIREQKQVLKPYKRAKSEGIHIDISPAMRSVVFPQAMDLGGIVKSWTVQQLSRYLRGEWMLSRGLINAGGDIEVWGGSAEGEPWVIAIANPHKKNSADESCLQLMTGAVATSSTLRRSWKTNEGRMHHLIDPRTMKPSQSSVIQCTVIGKDLIASEIWAKAMCILGVEDGIALLRERTEGIEALFYTSDGAVHHAKPSINLTKGQWIGLHADFTYQL
ncbi:FAD:protein FMN transferase [Paenibacillus sp. GCM10027628]|uniref:FAD:protein FMN transferase n=1 Tax=Paenibacillus sp. GCM10027628 TaxID=3273413 RepID=UPI0036453145